jgi:hypothetical protein
MEIYVLCSGKVTSCGGQMKEMQHVYVFWLLQLAWYLPCKGHTFVSCFISDSSEGSDH